MAQPRESPLSCTLSSPAGEGQCLLVSPDMQQALHKQLRALAWGCMSLWQLLTSLLRCQDWGFLPLSQAGRQGHKSKTL